MLSNRHREKEHYRFLVRLLIKFKVTQGYGLDAITTDDIVKDILDTLSKDLYDVGKGTDISMDGILKTIKNLQ